MKELPGGRIQLVITSPPYADNRRKAAYDGVPISEYIDWFLPISAEIKRLLRPRGSFVLNIKERAIKGERQTYVLELILAMKQQGWLWIDEYIWCKRNAYPGKWPNRFRDSWERCLHFTRQPHFDMYQEQVMVATGEWANKRLRRLTERDRRRDESRVQSGFGKNVSKWVGRDKVFPTNVIHLPTECSNKGHPATYPKALPMWFIRLFTKPGDLVLDPFIGSGTTALACAELGRDYFGIEIVEAYSALARRAAARARVEALRQRQASRRASRS